MGANGIAFWQDSFYVASTVKGLLVRVPIMEDGSAGEPELVAGTADCDAEFDELDSMDGIAVAEDGSVYALLVIQNKAVRIDPSDGSSTVLLTDADGLWNPASIIFGTGESDRESVFITNYAVLPPAPDDSLGPAVLKFDVGVPGEPAITPENVKMEPADKPEVVNSFDASRSELPEGITIDKAGNIYVSLGPPFWLPDVDYFGEIWKISPDGTEMVLAEIDGPPAAGLTVDASGNVYYAYPTSDENTRGVYRLTEDGSTERLPGTENIILANGVAFDKQGNLYVSDSILGAIWRIPSGEAAVAENWFQHGWLGGCEEDPFGANGVAYWKGSLYVASTTKGLLVRIPILTDGSAGEPEIVAGEDDCDPEFDELDSMDGIALDVDGNVYALLVIQHKLVRIDPNDGTSATLLTDADGLHNPASIAFGTGKDNQESVFFTNFAVLPPEPPASFGPAVLKFDVGVPGLPLP